MRGASANGQGLVKLWAFYPPTAKNRQTFHSAHQTEGKLRAIGQNLEEGILAVTLEGEAVTFGAGWIHATWTLMGGILVGLNWVDAADLDDVHDFFSDEYEACLEAGVFLEREVWRSLLWVWKACVKEGGDPLVRKRAAEALCLSHERIRSAICKERRWRDEQQMLHELVEQISKTFDVCPRCHISTTDGGHLQKVRRGKVTKKAL